MAQIQACLSWMPKFRALLFSMLQVLTSVPINANQTGLSYLIKFDPNFLEHTVFPQGLGLLYYYPLIMVYEHIQIESQCINALHTGLVSMLFIVC